MPDSTTSQLASYKIKCTTAYKHTHHILCSPTHIFKQHTPHKPAPCTYNTYHTHQYTCKQAQALYMMDGRAHTHTCTHAHTRTHTHTCTHARTHTHTHTHTHARTHAHMHTCKCMYTHTRTHAQRLVTINLQTHTHAYICTYKHTTLTLQHALHKHTQYFHFRVASHSNDYLTDPPQTLHSTLSQEALM